MHWFRGALIFSGLLANAETIETGRHAKPIEIVRDKWGVPHIYAETQDDLFFAQGYMAARDRLWQIDLWRRAATGKLSEVLGPKSVERDRLALLLRYRGDWNAEWTSYAPDTWRIATAFTEGINFYIRSRGVRRSADFRLAGYDPGLWTPNDILSRLPALPMASNLIREVIRAQEIQHFGLPTVIKFLPVDPAVPIAIPNGLNLGDITADSVTAFSEAVGAIESGSPGSNNWAVSGALTVSGKPLLASDPHRAINAPSLRRTVHLVAPGWNVIGAGEPALPGVALGHNEDVAFGFTIAGIDQQDLYVEKLHAVDGDRYEYKGEWKKVEIETQRIAVKGEKPRAVELRYTIHGPVLHVDSLRRRAYVLRWTGQEPGTAGYLAALSLARAHDWTQFSAAMARYKAPAENMVYADTKGNIGWIVGGLTPVRKNWNGLLPAPGHSGEFEWSGFLDPSELPRSYNPPAGFVATANNNILPPGYSKPLQYEWAPGFRVDRIREMLGAKGRKFSAADMERLQGDVVSLPARRFQAVLRRVKPQWTGARAAALKRILAWDCAVTADSVPAMIFELWLVRIPPRVFPSPALAVRVGEPMLLATLESMAPAALEPALAKSLDESLAELERAFGADTNMWQWGRVHQFQFQHPLGKLGFGGSYARPGDADTVNSTAGARFRQTNGASYRQVIDLADWDRSTMTNAPGESGDPESPFYSNLAEDWAAGRYHPMVYSRKAVEAAAAERIVLR